MTAPDVDALLRQAATLTEEADDYLKNFRGKSQMLAYIAKVQRVISRLAAALRAERERADRAENNYNGACSTIAAMHAAAVGEVTGPRFGVVEDVASVRQRAEAAEARVKDLEAAMRAILYRKSLAAPSVWQIAEEALEAPDEPR